MKVFSNKSLHIVRERIHTGSCSNKCRKIHSEQRIGKNDLRQQLRREQDAFTMRFILRNNRTTADFASCSTGCWNSNKIRDLLSYILIAADQIIIIEQITMVVYPQGNRTGNIHCRPSADPDD